MRITPMRGTKFLRIVDVNQKLHKIKFVGRTAATCTNTSSTERAKLRKDVFLAAAAQAQLSMSTGCMK
jgi:hypothetical protein